MSAIPGDDRAGSPERFGYSWERFSEPSAEQEAQFVRWTSPVDPAQGWIGRRILDVGCGAGRNSRWAMKYGAASGLAIDVDERSLAAARRNLTDYPQIAVEFRSIYQLERRDEFDLAFSIGVIHHLDNPQLALLKMKDAVKPGGQVLIWVYGYENMELFVHVLNPLRRALFSRLPLSWVSFLAHIPTSLLWAALRVIPFRLEYLRLIRGFPYRHLHHIVFDQMLPKIAHYWREAEVRTLMAAAGLIDISLTHVNGMSWAAIGRRP